MKKIFALVLFLIFLLPVSASATEYYLDVNSIGGPCSDSNQGTINQPWCTFYKANGELEPEDILYVRNGTYREVNPGSKIIAPENSGTPGNYITITNYQDEEVIISSPEGENVAWGIYLIDKSYIKINGLKTGKMKFWVDMRANPGKTSSHNIIQNCYFDGTKTEGGPWAGIWLGSIDGDNRGASEYNKIINNSFADVECQPDDVIYFIFGECRYNLIEGNTFDGGPHVTVEMQQYDKGNIEYNVIRNNIIKNELHTCVNVYGGSSWNLIDGNIIRDAGERHEENWCGSEGDRNAVRYVHGGIQLEGSNNIIRRNILFNNGRMAVENYGDHCDRNKIYHNTFYENYRDWDSVTGEDVDGNAAKNNIFWASRQKLIEHDVQGENRDNYFINNCMNGDGELIMWWPYGGNKKISYMEANLPNLWYGNINSNPEFLDPLNMDFRVQSDSLVINSGDFLTNISSSDGTGTSFTVEDSTYFIDGWGVIEGDLIQLENDTQTARITGVDYGTNTITVDTTLTWSNGQGVSLAYEGSKPDIGAYEYQQPKGAYYVDASGGDDSNDGLSPETAWRTINKVNNKWDYQTGDDILFKRGETWTDTGLDIHHSGTADDPVIIGAYGEGPKPTIDGNGDLGGSAINSIYSADYITIQDFRIINMVHGNYDGISFCCNPRSHITISRVDVNNTNNCGIYLDQTDTYIIENSTIGHVGNAGIVIYGSALNKTKNGIIRNCVSHDARSNDAFTLHKNDYGDDIGPNHLLENCIGYNSAEEAFDIGSGGNITLLNCESYSNDNGAISVGNSINNVVIDRFYTHDENEDGIIIGPSANVKLTNSLIYNTGRYPLTINNCTSFEGYHNTIIENGGSFDIGQGVQNVTFKNNIIIYYGWSRFMRYLFDSPATTNSDFSHNIWFMSGETENSDLWYDVEYGHTYDFNFWRSYYNQGEGSMFIDPLLTDPQNGDGRLTENSSAINAGIFVGLTYDFEGNPRPQLGDYDIGAYEYQSGAAYPPGDLDYDYDVDIFDLQIVTRDFGLTSGFDPRADTIPSGEIDIFDVVFVASRFTG